MEQQPAISSSSSSSARPPQALEQLDDASLRQCHRRLSQPDGPFFGASVSSSGTDARPPLVLVLPAPSLFACVRICRSNLRAVAPLPRTLLAISMVTFVLMWWGFCFFCFSRCLFVSSADGCESSSDHIFLLTCAGSVPAHHRGRSRESNTSPHAHEQTFTYLFPRLPHTRVEAAVDLKHTSSELMRGSHGHIFGRTQA